MGIRIRGASEEEVVVSPSSLRGALLLATVCIVGLPVEVHIKDGSIYSGIFHTACADGGYGIVLKKARMVKRGTRVSNISNGVVIDTLVVLPGDLVQVVAKGVTLSADGISANVACDNNEAVHSTNTKNSFQPSESEGVYDDIQVDKEKMQSNQNRQVGGCMPRGEAKDHHYTCSFKDQPVHGMEGPSTNIDEYNLQIDALVENHTSEESKQLRNGRPAENGAAPDAKSLGNGHSTHSLTGIPDRDAVSSSVSNCVKPVGDATFDRNCGSASQPVPTQHLVAKRSVKESKLNPGAKIFSPSSVNVRSVAPPMVPTVASMAYASNNFPVMPITVPQPEVGIRHSAPRSSWPAKFVPHSNFTVANGGNGLQYAQPVQIAGHIANRTQPIRYSGQYQPVQAGVPYVLTNPSNLSQGMIGRVGQLVYVHPVTQDMGQAEAVVPHAPHPLLPQQHHIHIPEHDGLVMAQPPQLSLTLPLMAANVQQQPPPFPLPSHVQLSQPPFQTIRPITVIGSNGPYNIKFP
ncbi:hypothetical protein Dimus_012506 [Dionaea muscipula]